MTEQIRGADYLAHGRIVSASWVEIDRATQRPYSYWKMKVIGSGGQGTLSDDTITIRSPGGEMGGMGYHVAGAARFTEQEEVVLTLRDSAESTVKEVIGLVSGKYNVITDPVTGRKTVKGFLGKPLLHLDGKPFTVDQFLALARRVGRGEDTEADKKIFLNKGIAHDQDTVLDKRIAEIEAMKKGRPPAPAAAPIPQAENNLSPPQEDLQNPSFDSEKPTKGVSVWLVGLTAFLAIAALAAIFLRKK